MDYRQSLASEELCPVCGDRVSGYHYGLLTCESCKGFFKRTVQNNKKYVCAESQKCRIDKAQRKRCPFCRFQKCLDVGMRLEAVRADRMRGGRNKFGPMYKQDRALKQQRKALALEQAPLVSSHLCTEYLDVLHSVPIPHCITAQEDVFSYRPLALSTPLPNITSETIPFPLHPEVTWVIKSNPSDHSTVAHVRSEDLFCELNPRVPPLVIEFLRCDPDEIQLQNKIRVCLQQLKPQWEKHGLPSLFRLMFFLGEHTLFSIVEWARTSVFFKHLKVSDQMTLLHNCWSELLLLDVICRQVLKGKQGHLLLITGHEVDLSAAGCNAGPILSSLVQKGQDLTEKFQLLKVDRQEFVCMKFLIVFNPDGKQLEDHSFIERVQEQVHGALLEYVLSSQYLGRFTQLLQCLSEVRFLSTLAEDYLWSKHQSDEVPCNSLLIEMLHAKRGNA